MSDENYNLHWNGHKENSAVSFKDALTQLEFTDVTLVSDDDKQIKSHKFVLSSCSPVFRNILVNNPHKHPLIYLTDVKHEELKSILDFMYLGEAVVAQDELERLMKIATKFQIKGISVIGNGKEREEENVSKHEPLNNVDNYQIVSEEEKCVEDDIENTFDTSENIESLLNHHTKAVDLTSGTVENIIKGAFQCGECDYRTFHSRNFKRHVRTMHSSLMLVYCNHCDFQTKPVSYTHLTLPTILLV